MQLRFLACIQDSHGLSGCALFTAMALTPFSSLCEHLGACVCTARHIKGWGWGWGYQIIKQVPWPAHHQVLVYFVAHQLGGDIEVRRLLTLPPIYKRGYKNFYTTYKDAYKSYFFKRVLIIIT